MSERCQATTKDEMKTEKTFKINLDLFALADMFLHLSFFSISFSAHLAQHKQYNNKTNLLSNEKLSKALTPH